MQQQPAGTRRHGTVTRWDDAKGFGFVEPALGGRRLFVHVSAFPRGQRPVDGNAITYVEGRDERGRVRALEARLPSAGRRDGRERRSGGALLVAVVVAAAWFAALGVLVAMGVTVVVPAVCAVMSAISLGLYGADKAAARSGAWRTPESTLHLVDLLGGWPGALVARPAFRHKTIKQPFRTVFWITVVTNIAILAALVVETPPLLR